MMILSALAALTLTAAVVPGRYRVEGAGERCTVTLQPTAGPLPESDLTPDMEAGFVIAAPSCDLGIDEATLWRLSVADGGLELINDAGDLVFDGQASNEGWTGVGRFGRQVQLVRN